MYSTQPQTGGRTNTDWTVRAIGVKVTDDGEPWFIVRLVSTFVNPATLQRLSDHSDVAHDDQGRAMLGFSEVPGPYGVRITANEFVSEVADGCVMCNKHVGLSDAHDVVWVMDGVVCPNCDERLYEGELE